MAAIVRQSVAVDLAAADDDPIRRRPLHLIRLLAFNDVVMVALLNYAVNDATGLRKGRAVQRALQKGSVTGKITTYEDNSPHDQCPGRNETTSQ